MNLLSLDIDRKRPLPIYHQLRQAIEDLITDGQLAPGDTLPSENEFSKAYRISPMTVRQAMNELVNSGYIHRERGRGTFVSIRRFDHQLERLLSFSEDMEARNLTPTAKILHFEQTPPPNIVLEKTALTANDLLLRIQRVRYADGQAVGVHDSYLHNVNISQDELESKQSLYQLLEQHNIYLYEGNKTIEAVSATRELAELLHVDMNVPLLKTTQFSWGREAEFIEFVEAYYHADLYQYTIQLRR